MPSTSEPLFPARVGTPLAPPSTPTTPSSGRAGASPTPPNTPVSPATDHVVADRAAPRVLSRRHSAPARLMIPESPKATSPRPPPVRIGRSPVASASAGASPASAASAAARAGASTASSLRLDLLGRQAALEGRATQLGSKVGWARRATRILTGVGAAIGLLVFATVSPAGLAAPFLGLAAGLLLTFAAKAATRGAYAELAAEQQALREAAREANVTLPPGPQMAKLDRFYARGIMGDLAHEAKLAARPFLTMVGAAAARAGAGVAAKDLDPHAEEDRLRGRAARLAEAEAAGSAGPAATPPPAGPGPLEQGMAASRRAGGGDAAGSTPFGTARETRGDGSEPTGFATARETPDVSPASATAAAARDPATATAVGGNHLQSGETRAHDAFNP